MNRYLLLIALLTLVSCHHNRSSEQSLTEKGETSLVSGEKKEFTKESFFHIDLWQMVDKSKLESIKMSTLFSDIEYIPLETTSESLIGSGRFSMVGNVVTKKIIVVDMKIFDRKDGHYIGDLLQQGQGPEEYLQVMSLAADDEREELYLYDASKMLIHVVGYDNSYKGIVGGTGDYAGVLNLGKGNIIISNEGSSLSSRHDVFFIINVDTKETLYKRVSPAFQGIRNFEECERVGRVGSYITIRGNIYNKIWENANRISYYDALTDTVYGMKSDYEMIPVGFIDTEKMRMTQEELEVGFLSRKSDVWWLRGINEGPGFVLINFLCQSPGEIKTYWGIYSKDDKQIYSVTDNSNENHKFFVNDLDQGISFNPYYSAEGGMYSFLSSESIKEYIAEKGSSYFTTERGKRYKAMGDQLKYDDNDVIAILKWK